MRRHALALVALLLAGCASAPSAAPQDEPLLVAAASDLQGAFTELAETYTAQTGRPVRFSFGSSGQLAEQLKNGAPFELYASASARYVDEVLAAGRGEPASRAEYAVGRLAVWTPDEEVALGELVAPRFRRIAIANPEHAPYGLAAHQALDSAGVLDRVQDRLVLGESVTDTLRLATSGNADAALVALSLVVDGAGRYVVVPEQAHAPLRQALLVTAPPARQEAAQAFADLVLAPEGRRLLARYGFGAPAAEG